MLDEPPGADPHPGGVDWGLETPGYPIMFCLAGLR